jgi:WD40 repeat protein
MTAAPRDPFKFLDPYTRADRDIFFGRDRETEELYARLLASGLLLVYGVSGTGKTSLVQCGLANKFEPADCLAITVRRGANLLEALDAELARHALTPAPPGAPLTKRVRSLYLDHFKPIHLIFDQLEELFIFGDREERRAFGQALHDLASLERDVRLIFVVREEYLGAMTEFEPLLPDLFRSRIRIERMDRFQAREAIEGPCERCGVTLDPGVADEVLTRLAPAEATVELTWLQVVMDRLYRQAADQNPERPALTLAGLAGLGRLDNVLGRFLEEQLTALDQPLAGEAVLKALVSGDGTRRPLSLAAIGDSATVRAQGLTGEALPALIQRLIAARILSDRDEHGNYELRHDSLARKVWERMTAREKELQEIRQTIDIRYRDYRRRGLLLDAETLTYLAPYEDSLFLSPEQAAFVKTSREAAARRRRWLTLAFSTLILVLVVVSGLGVYGYLKAVEAEQQAAEASQQRGKAEQKAAEAARKEKDARHNLGLVFLEKAERLLADRHFNEARLYAYHALANFDPQRAGPKSATVTVLRNPVYPPAFVTNVSADGSMSFSPDGRTLASGSGDTIRLWDLATGQEQAVLAGHTEQVTGVSFSPDGRTLASGSLDKTIRLWDLATGKEQVVLWGNTAGAGVTSMSFSPDGRTLASVSHNPTIQLWDLTTGKEQAMLWGHDAYAVTSVSFSPDGRTLASGSEDKTIRLWDLATGKERAVLTGHTDDVTSVSFSPDGRTLASGSWDNTIRLWDLATGKERAVLAGHTNLVYSVSFSPDGRTLASGSWDNTIRLWDLATGKEQAVLAGHTESVESVAFSPDGRTLASGSKDKTIRLWDLATGQEQAVLATGRRISLSFSPDGRLAAVAVSEDKTIRLWDLATGKERAVLAGHTESVDSVAFSPDGRTLASGSYD